MLFVLTLVVTDLHAALPSLLHHYVTDDAALLAPRTELKLEQFLEAFERSDSTQLAVVTIESLEGRDLSGYSIELAENTRLGQQSRDNGILLLIAKQEHQIRIEVGKGLEGRLTDLLAGRIIDQEISPRFRQGDFDGGIVAGVSAIADAVRGEYQGTTRHTKRRKSSSFGWLLFLLFLAPRLFAYSGRRRHSTFWMGGGGGFGGGGFSGGGGSFGGGGASGNW
ncbi:MAG: TPM domain-containing protein [Desulfuromonadaceae bacterium]|nr:TPM domain-containing protein [Desulfuromonadaceae bacterium]